MSSILNLAVSVIILHLSRTGILSAAVHLVILLFDTSYFFKLIGLSNKTSCKSSQVKSVHFNVPFSFTENSSLSGTDEDIRGIKRMITTHLNETVVRVDEG